MKILCRRVIQPIGEFYVTVIGARELKNMASADVRRVNSIEEEYSGIQRQESIARKSEINRFISTVDASFPSSIILNINKDYIIKTTVCKEMPGGDHFYLDVKVENKTFEIIDGQHRLSGFDEKNSDNFDLIASIFVDLDIESRAYLFTTINSTPVRVNKSLAYDLFGVADTPSPQKTAHTVTMLLNSDEESALYRQIKLLGVTPKFDGKPLYKPFLSQGTVVKRLIKLISNDPDGDRSKEKDGKLPLLSDTYMKDGLIFRKFYLDREDGVIYKILNNYFVSISEYYQKEWNDPNNPLNKTIGFEGLMDAFIPAYTCGFEEKDVSYNYFQKITEESRKKYEAVIASCKFLELTMDNYSAQGSTGRFIGNFFKALFGFSDLNQFVDKQIESRERIVEKLQN